MPGKEKANTSKTAHVMNLLSKNRPTAPIAEETGGEDQQLKQTGASLPPIISSLAPDAAVSSEIQSALEASLEEELKQAVTTPPTPSPQSAAEETAAREQAERDAAAQVVITPEVEPEAQDGSSATQDPAAEDAPEEVPEETPDKTTYINVMQALVEERADRYIQMFGLCQCQRCVTDVKALALNNLQPKYVVMQEGEMVPRLTVYEAKFNSEVTAQILRACKVVMEKPRHDGNH